MTNSATEEKDSQGVKDDIVTKKEEPLTKNELEKEYDMILEETKVTLLEMCSIKTLKKNLMTRLILENIYPTRILDIHEIYEGKELQALSASRVENTDTVDNIVPKIDASIKLSVDKKDTLLVCDNKNSINSLDNNSTFIDMNLQDYPEFKEPMYFDDWVKIMERIFRIKTVTDEKMKIDIVMTKLGERGLWFTVDENSYPNCIAQLSSKFKKAPTDAQLLIEYGMMQFNLTTKDVEKVAEMTLKCYKNETEQRQIAEFTGKLITRAKTTFLQYVIREAATKSRLNDAVQMIIMALGDNMDKPREKKRCFWCNYPGHVENVCERKKKGLEKKDYYTENMQKHQRNNNKEVMLINSIDSANEPREGEVMLLSLDGIEDDIDDSKYMKVVLTRDNAVIECVAFKDSGADIPVISKKLANQLNITNLTDMKVKSFGGIVETKVANQLNPEVVVSMGNYESKLCKTIVEDTGYEMILSRNMLNEWKKYQHKVVINDKDVNNKDKHIKDIENKFNSIIAKDRFDIGCCTLKAPETDYKFKEMKKFVRYDPNKDIITVLKKDIQPLLDKHIISRGIPKYNLNIVPVKKSDGSYRICLNMQPYNEMVQKRSYCSPKVTYFFEHIGEYKWLSKIDITQAYLQIKWHENNKNDVGFHLGSELFILNRLAFGFVNAPAIWQELIDFMMQGLPCLSYQDDIIHVSNKSMSQHILEDHQILTRLQQHGITINFNKSIFAVQREFYLGRLLLPHGLSIADKYKHTLRNMKVPTTIYELRRLRGLVNYMAEFVPNLALMEKRLNRFIGGTPKSEGRKKVEISPEILADIEQIKIAIENAPVLAYIDFKKPFYLFTDASEEGMGALLAQPISDSINIKAPNLKLMRPVLLWSKALQPYKKITPIVVLELRAIAEALLYFRHVVFGRDLVIYTDHRNLISIIQHGTDPRYSKYIYTILSFTPRRIIYINGDGNSIADFLSRMPMHSTEEGGEIFTIENIDQNNEMPNFNIESNMSMEKLVELLFDETHLKMSHLSLNKLYPLVKNVLVQKVKKLRLIRRVMGMLRKKISNCTVCIKHNELRRKKLITDEIKKPFDRVDIDVLFFENHSIMIAIDTFSGFVTARILKSQNVQQVIEFLELEIFTKWGLPLELHCDNYKTFHAKEFKEFLFKKNIRVTYSIPGSHSTNQKVERAIRTVKSLFRKEIEQHGNFIKRIPQILFNYNAAPDEILQISPIDILYSFKVRTTPIENHEGMENLQSLELKLLDNQIKKLPTAVYVKDLLASSNRAQPRNKLIQLNKNVNESGRERILHQDRKIIPLLKCRWEATGSSTKDFKGERGEWSDATP
uniref:RNA-directed DNA polymerase n=1 Tax=Strongyloides papillosus TaxID=174720 RepID=A0A0N5CH31_STREA